MPRDQARRQLSLEDRHPIVLYYGSITEWVDYGVLLEATAKLKERYPKMLLLLVGKIYKQSEELEIKQRIEELKNYQPPPVEGFKTDEARVVATALDRLTNVIIQKRPLEIVAESLSKFLAPHPTERPQYIEKKEESKSSVVELLEGTEYVAEE